LATPIKKSKKIKRVPSKIPMKRPIGIPKIKPIHPYEVYPTKAILIAPTTAPTRHSLPYDSFFYNID